MARISDGQLPWFAARALQRSIGGRYTAADFYPHLDAAEPGAKRSAQQRRQRVDSEIANLGRMVRDGVPDENPPPRAQPRRQSMSEIACHVYPDLNSDAADRARERYERWQERLMPWGFTRQRAPQEHPDWWPRKAK